MLMIGNFDLFDDLVQINKIKRNNKLSIGPYYKFDITSKTCVCGSQINYHSSDRYYVLCENTRIIY